MKIRLVDVNDPSFSQVIDDIKTACEEKAEVLSTHPHDIDRSKKEYAELCVIYSLISILNS